MRAVITKTEQVTKQNIKTVDTEYIPDLVKQSWQKIAPFWPLKNLIAVNPLQGLENMPIEQALTEGASYFQSASLPKPMEAVNRETIKWLQAYFDDGQATIPMPLRSAGLYAAWRQLVTYDTHLHGNVWQKTEWLAALPSSPEQVITKCLLYLNILKEERVQFLTLLLTTLPGWAAYIKYRTEWAELGTSYTHPITQTEYLAMRLIIICLLWPEAKTLLSWHQQAIQQAKASPSPLRQIQTSEQNYRLPLLKQLAVQPVVEPHIPGAQLVFCIDVRSEPFRRCLEATGDYETFGFAGFFGIPAKIIDTVSGQSYASCPVLLSPKHEVKESPCTKQYEHSRKGYERLTSFKRLYQSVKYTFTTPFALVEILGMASGLWMGLRTLAPSLASKLKSATVNLIHTPLAVAPSLDDIAFTDQCSYAEGALRLIGLTHNFAPLVVFCGHGSSTENNAYATALDCGACGGRQGASNARILAAIMNRVEIREYLAKQGIIIPEETKFIAAQHNTTTDKVSLYTDEVSDSILQLKYNLEKARQTNNSIRLKQLQKASYDVTATHHIWSRSQDWAQVRPEWGLARNATFIVAPRYITQSLDLEGRSFLHSYDYTQDPEGTSLSTILTAPMVVAEWINTQYLFSTLDNVAYGSGSKITKNITGKIGIMQGNASDLMTGLPLQSVYASDVDAYHEPQRLMTVVYAPRRMLNTIIQAQPVLQKLFGNGWVQLACIEPEDRKTYFLAGDFTWQKVH